MVDFMSFLPFAGFGALIGVFFFIALASYLYFAFVLMTLGKKLNYDKPWLAWIPIANIAMILQMGGFHWAWVFLVLVPILGWIALGVLNIICFWRIYEARKYPGWLALAMLGSFIPFIGNFVGLANLIILSVVAFRDVS